MGMADSLGMGSGPRAVLMTRVVAEGQRVLEALGGHRETFAGLAGLGNLLVRTDRDSQAPGYRVGLKLGAGQAPGSGRVPDEVKAVGAGARLAKRAGLRAPVLEEVAKVVAGDSTAALAAAALGEQVATQE